MLYFHDRIRLLNCLKYRSRICKLNLLADGPLISPERALQLDLDNRELRRTRFAAGLRAHAAAVPGFRLFQFFRFSFFTISTHSHFVFNFELPCPWQWSPPFRLIHGFGEFWVPIGCPWGRLGRLRGPFCSLFGDLSLVTLAAPQSDK